MSNKAGTVKVRTRFGERMKKARKNLGLSQEKLAFETGMDLTSINEIEKARRSPTLTTIHKIARALKISARDLIS